MPAGARPVSDDDVARLYPQAAEIFGRIKPRELGLEAPFVARFHVAAGNRLVAEIEGRDLPIVWNTKLCQWRDP